MTGLPAGAMPIDTDELLAAIGELYLQVRMYRRVLALRQSAAQPTNEAEHEHADSS